MARREGTAPVCRVQVPPVRQPSAMAHVSARTPPGRAARRPGNADLRPVLPVGAGTARERETSADDAAPCQRGSPPSPNPGCRDRSPLPLPGAAPFSCPAGCTGGPDHGRFSRRGPAPRPDGAAKPRTAVTPHGSAGEETPPVAVRMQARRDASSPDCAPTPERRPVLPVGAFTPAPPRAAGQEGVLPSSAMAQVSARTPPGRAARRPGNADLRPVLPVGAGTARERETSADDAAPCQREFPTLSQPWMLRPLTSPSTRGRAFFMPGGVYGRTRSWAFLPERPGTAVRRGRETAHSRYPAWLRGRGNTAGCCENAGAPGRQQPGLRADPGTPASSPGGGVHTRTAPRSGARGRTSQFRNGARLGTYPTRKSGTPARERRPPVGTARERETSADNAAPCQREFPTLSQPWMLRPLTSPSTPRPDGAAKSHQSHPSRGLSDIPCVGQQTPK